MINFCTLFDSNYLARGLALYQSLEKHCPAFHLYIVAFNEAAYQYLSQHPQPHYTVIRLQDFEDPALLQVKPTRNAAEYCWTCTPSIIRYCIQQFNLHACTYIDADMLFYSNPAVMIADMGDKDVLITEHFYTPAYDQSTLSGRFCVQFMTFKNTAPGMEVLEWWRNACLDWCYARFEDGKFGDQKYLDTWPAQFTCVHISQQRGGGVAPWNVQQFTVKGQDSNGNTQLLHKSSGNTYPLIFFHYHGVKFHTGGYASLCGPLYEISPAAKQQFYYPYIRQLLALAADIEQQAPGINANGAHSPAPAKAALAKGYAKNLLQLLFKKPAAFFRFKNFRPPYHYHIFDTAILSSP